MQILKCTDVIRNDSGRITKYEICGISSKMYLTPSQLRGAILTGGLQVENVKLAKNNRIMVDNSVTSGDNNYTQLCVWVGTILEDNQIREFEEFFSDIGYRVKYSDKFKETKSRGLDNLSCILFYIHKDDIPRFAIRRFNFGNISWWEDYVDNWKEYIPKTILSKYKKTW